VGERAARVGERAARETKSPIGNCDGRDWRIVRGIDLDPPDVDGGGSPLALSARK
jgi:hypothetical protein